MRYLPEGTDFLFLAPRGKGLLPHTQSQQRFEMFSFGITLACLPPSDRFARDAQVFGQIRLRQANVRPQGQHGLPKGIVSLTIGDPLHRSAPSLPRDLQERNQKWEVMGSDMPTDGR